MSYTFQNMSEVPALEKPTESTTVMGFDNGAACQIPADQFGGKGLVLPVNMNEVTGQDMAATPPTYTFSTNYDVPWEAIKSGTPVVLSFMGAYLPPLCTEVTENGLEVCFYYSGANGIMKAILTGGSYHTAAANE